MGQVVFVTGTDTGVGKTLLTALLVRHLRDDGEHALAMKPFCSGGVRDAEILSRAQDGELGLDQISPFRFKEPLAPLVAARRNGRRIGLDSVLNTINMRAAQSTWLLVEGVGGLLVPLGESYTFGNVVAGLGCPVVVVAKNKLGVINHTLLTLSALRQFGIVKAKVVLMETRMRNRATATNPGLLADLIGKRGVCRIPFLGQNPLRPEALRRNAEKLKKTLAHILEMGSFLSAFSNLVGERKSPEKKKKIACTSFNKR